MTEILTSTLLSKINSDPSCIAKIDWRRELGEFYVNYLLVEKIIKGIHDDKVCELVIEYIKLAYSEAVYTSYGSCPIILPDHVYMSSKLDEAIKWAKISRLFNPNPIAVRKKNLDKRVEELKGQGCIHSPSINLQHVDTLNNYHGACHIAAVGKTQVYPSEKDYNTSASVPFSALVTNPLRTDAILKKLHELVERPGKPKTIIMPIRAAMDAGAISRPTWEQFCTEFGANRVKSKSSLTDYTNENYNFVGNDFESMKATFCSLMQ